ncbi:hypothetical protein B6D29_01385 [Microgenomates bacterium UTCPR1]|nr:MAG: hypothetical protein B6D29_01385 [Microgenomates bacterium UTCPR1]
MHPLQSPEWEKARNEMGVETIKINGFLLSLHKIPYTKFKIGYLPRSAKPDGQTIKKILNYGKTNNLIFVKIEPYAVSSTQKLEQDKPTIVKSKHPLFPQWTQILELDPNEDNLLRSFHPKTRYNIRLAEKKGVIVQEESNTDGFKKFIKLYFETTRRQKYLGHNMEYHQTVWKNLKGKIAHILIAYYQGEPLAAYQLWFKDNVLYYVYGGTSDKNRNLMASNLLMWEAIKLGKKLGAKKFDMWGSLPPGYKNNHPWAGFTRFKQGYGTKFIKFIDSYDLVINPFWYGIYGTIYKARELLLKVISLLKQTPKY